MRLFDPNESESALNSGLESMDPAVEAVAGVEPSIDVAGRVRPI
jgi:hypothetical protein